MPLTLGNPTIRVDISLCSGGGSCRSSAALVPHDSSRTSAGPTVLVSDTAKNGSLMSSSQSERQAQGNNMMITSSSSSRSSSLLIEPPQWAVPAKNESRLEPVGDAIGSHPVVDLTQSSFLRVGRSPSSDLQLLHCSSSRRHALLFHHPNGSCYVVDCGSVHGTYVNGVRLRSTNNDCRIIPTRVRRGALIRFGGEGAPSFVLKTKMIGFSHLISTEEEEEEEVSDQPTLSPKPRRNQGCVVVGGGILKKRSFEESSSSDDESMQDVNDDDGPPSSKRRCESPDIISPTTSLPLRLVSPELASTKRVTFADDQALALLHTITYSTEEEGSASEDDEQGSSSNTSP